MNGIRRFIGRIAQPRVLISAAVIAIVVASTGSTDVACSGLASGGSQPVATQPESTTGEAAKKLKAGRMDDGKVTVYYKSDGRRHRALEVIASKHRQSKDMAVLRIWNIQGQTNAVQVTTDTTTAFSGSIDPEGVMWVTTACSGGKLTLLVTTSVGGVNGPTETQKTVLQC